MDTKTLSDPLANVSAKALFHALVEVLLDVLAYTLAQTEPMKIDDTLADVEGIAYTIR